MTITEVARVQGCSVRAAQRFCMRGLQGHVLRSSRAGKKIEVTQEDFTEWRILCGFEKVPRKPKHIAIRSQHSDERKPVDIPAQPELSAETAIPQMTPTEDDYPKMVQKTIEYLDKLDVTEWNQGLIDALSDGNDITPLEEGRRIWLLPANPGGPPTTTPHETSGTMPTPANMLKFNYAGAVINLWRLKHTPQPKPKRSKWFVPHFSR